MSMIYLDERRKMERIFGRIYYPDDDGGTLCFSADQ